MSKANTTVIRPRHDIIGNNANEKPNGLNYDETNKGNTNIWWTATDDIKHSHIEPTKKLYSTESIRDLTVTESIITNRKENIAFII